METARLAAARAVLGGVALASVGGVYSLCTGAKTWLYLVWWPTLALFLPLVTVAERRLQPLRAHHLTGLALVLAVLAVGFVHQPTYLHGVAEGQDAAQIAANLKIRLELWSVGPHVLVTLSGAVASSLVGVCLLRRRRAELGWQVLVPVLLILLVTLLGHSYDALYVEYQLREVSAAQRAAWGLEFDPYTFVHDWFMRDLWLTLPLATACAAYVLASHWLERRQEARLRAA